MGIAAWGSWCFLQNMVIKFFCLSDLCSILLHLISCGIRRTGYLNLFCSGALDGDAHCPYILQSIRALNVSISVSLSFNISWMCPFILYIQHSSHDSWNFFRLHDRLLLLEKVYLWKPGYLAGTYISLTVSSTLSSDYDN